MEKKIVVLTGSTRGGKTVTDSITNYLEERFHMNKDVKVNICRFKAHEMFRDQAQMDCFVNELRNSDLLLLCSPVFVHSLPYPVISVMEQLDILDRDLLRKNKMAVIIHNGYPQSIQRESCFQISRNFADRMELEWLGGIGFGGSPIIAGKTLEELGWFTKWMRRSLDEAAENMLHGHKVSETARRYADKHFPSIPLFILVVLMNMRIKKEASDKGIDIYNHPYLDRDNIG